MRTYTGFAGAGLADIGLTAAGCEHVRCVEWDDAAARTLDAAGFPAWHGDIRDPACTEGVGPIDLAWFSPPCQDWSLAGRRKGADGERNGWPWTWDAVDRLQPRWLIAENVTGMLHHAGKHCGDGCCADPAKCPATYFHEVILAEARKRFAWVGWRVLDAADFGTPQFRRRVFVVGGPGPIDWPEPTHGDPETLAQVDLFAPRLLPWVSCGEALGLGEPVGGGTNPHSKGAGHERTFRRIEREPCTTIAAAQIGNAGPWAFVRTEQTGAVGSPVSVPVGTVGTVGNQYLHSSDPGVRAVGMERVRSKGSGPRPMTQLTSPAPMIGSNQGSGGQAGVVVVTERAGSEPERLARLAPSVTTTEAKGTRGKHMGAAMKSGGKRGGVDRASDALWLATGRRRLSPAECSILMGAPADYPYQGTKSQRYAQVGNGVVPIVAQRLAEAVMRADR